jgi:trimeric autotransporter adhesin
VFRPNLRLRSGLLSRSALRLRFCGATVLRTGLLLAAGCPLLVAQNADPASAVQGLSGSGPATSAPAASVTAATPSATQATSAPSSCRISGHIASGKFPLPGVAVSAANSLTGQKVLSSTALDGSYSLKVPPRGRYVVRAELAAFAPATAEVVINPQNCDGRADIELTLASRLQEQEQTQSGQTQQAAQGPGAERRGFQDLALNADLGALNSPGMGANEAAAGGTGSEGFDSQMPALPSAAYSSAADTESLAVSGTSGQTNDAMFGGNNPEMQQRIADLRERARNGQLQPGEMLQLGGGEMGGPGGPGGGGLILLGGGGGRGGGFGGGRRMRFDPNQPHGTLFYSLGDSALDAKPYSLTGDPIQKPGYLQQHYGASLGGPLKIPKLFDLSSKMFFFANYSGSQASNPYNAFSTVPTLLERAGDFSQTVVRSGPDQGQPVQIYDPLTGQPFAGNRIPADRLNPAAVGLLQYVPLPNLPGSQQNFQYVTSGTANSDAINLRLNRNFGAAGGGPFGGRGGFGGGLGGSRGLRNSLSFGLNYQRSQSTQNNPFPTVLGNSSMHSWNLPIGWTLGKGRWNNRFQFRFNRNSANLGNLYGFQQNVAGGLGITGISQNPFFWGLPSLSFSNFSGLQDVSPSARDDQSFLISDFVGWSHGKHRIRFGGDLRWNQSSLKSSPNSRGSFVFTGLYTAGPLAASSAAGVGFDLADFLLGLPQQASVQYGSNRYRFGGNAWSLFLQDDWRLRGNLTLDLGVRYEYVSPLVEAQNQIVNLDVTHGFTAAVPVLPGQTGQLSGTAFPRSLVRPDRNNFAPRAGIAWKPFRNTVVRAGYGINYNNAQYNTIASQMTFQPPFAFTQTNIGSVAVPLLLQNAFPALDPSVTTNNYGIDPNYRLGYVQMWNLDIQQQIKRSLIVNIDYTGSKGTGLDIVRAPNRGPAGLRIAGVQPFLWESSGGSSILHSGSVRVRRRLQSGISFGGTYVFSKSIDNASSIGGGASVVAQNDLDLAAERGLSSFDQRHRLSLDYGVELPFGLNHRWLANAGMLNLLFGEWQWSGSLALASGTPFTPRVLGSFADVSRGTNGTLRADVTGQPVSLANPTVLEWFNTAAFAIPPGGQFGDARRNTIPGPRTFSLNMAVSKNIRMGEVRGLEVRATLNNAFNTPQFTGLDTVVNSPTFGRVTSAGAMRRITLSTRFHF